MSKRIGESYACQASCHHLTRNRYHDCGTIRRVQCRKTEGHTEAEHVGEAGKDSVLWRDHQNGLVWDGAEGPHGRWLTMEQAKSEFTLRKAKEPKEAPVDNRQNSLLDWDGSW